MKKLSLFGMSCVLAMALSGCGAYTASTSGLGPAMITSIQEPVVLANGSNVENLKKGEAECTNILGIVATGDCSIHEAAKEGKITEIYYVDKEVTNVLFIYGTVKVIVYGK